MNQSPISIDETPRSYPAAAWAPAEAFANALHAAVPDKRFATRRHRVPACISDGLRSTEGSTAGDLIWKEQPVDGAASRPGGCAIIDSLPGRAEGLKSGPVELGISAIKLATAIIFVHAKILSSTLRVGAGCRSVTEYHRSPPMWPSALNQRPASIAQELDVLRSKEIWHRVPGLLKPDRAPTLLCTIQQRLSMQSSDLRAG